MAPSGAAFDLANGVAVLTRTPATLTFLLRDLPAQWVDGDEGPETWSPTVVIGHLNHGERTDWIPRARMILQHGEAQAFEPFDRVAQLTEGRDKTLGSLLDEFADLRGANLRTLADWNLTPGDLARTGTHPELGRVTLAELLATWVVHDLDHVVQIARVMAKQLDVAVGPWAAYLSVLRDRTR